MTRSWAKSFIAGLLFLLIGVGVVRAQVPVVQSGTLFSQNSFIPTIPSTTTFTMNIGPGTVVCNGFVVNYNGGSIPLTPANTTYIYLDPTNSCAVTAGNSGGFPAGSIPIATAVATATTVASALDYRAVTLNPGAGGGGGGGNPGGADATIQINRLGVFGAATGFGLNSSSSPTLFTVPFNETITGNTVINGTLTLGSVTFPTLASATGTLIDTNGTLTLGTLNLASSSFVQGFLGTGNGGTGISTSSSTGVAQVAAGTWSVSLGLPSGTTAITQPLATNNTTVATTAFVIANAGTGGGFTAAGDLSGSGTSQTVIGINNVTLSTLTPGILKLSAGGIPSIASPGTDYVVPSVTTLSSLVSVGTIATGVWHGTPVGAQYGGTGQNSSASSGVAQLTTGTWSFGAVNLGNSSLVTGNLSVNNLNGGTGATSTTFWSGNGTWQTPSLVPSGDLSASPVNQTVAALQGNTLTLGTLVTGQVLYYNGTAIVNAYQGVGVDVQNTAGTGNSYTPSCPLDRFAYVEYSLTAPGTINLAQNGSTACWQSNAGMVIRNPSTSNSVLTVTATTSNFLPEGGHSKQLLPTESVFIYGDGVAGTGNWHAIVIHAAEGGSVTYTTSTGPNAGDNGKLVVMNCASACSYTIGPQFTNGSWHIHLMSKTGAGALATVALSAGTTFNNTTAPTLTAGVEQDVQQDSVVSTNFYGGIPGSGGSSAFNALTSGTNTTAAMVVGAGSSLSATGGGTIAATSVVGTLNGNTYPASGGFTAGGVLCATGGGTIAAGSALPTGDFVLGGGSSCPTATFSIVPKANGGTGLDTSGSAIHSWYGSTGTGGAPSMIKIGASDVSLAMYTTPVTFSSNLYTASVYGLAAGDLSGPGVELRFEVTNANTGAATFNACGSCGTQNLQKITNGSLTALVANDLTTGIIYRAIFDGTEWVLQNPNTGASTISSCSTTNALAIFSASTTISCGNGDFTYATHTVTASATGILDMSAGTWKVPSAAGFNATSSSMLGYDTTAGELNEHIWSNATDSLVMTVPASATIVNGHCVQFVKSTSYIGLSDTGSACGSSSTTFGGVNSQTANYTAVTGDLGKLLTFNGASLKLTLPASPPSATWNIHVTNTSHTTPLWIARNGNNIDGAAFDTQLQQDRSICIFTDGSNWFTGCSGLAPMARPNNRRWAYITPQSNSAITATGDVGTETANTKSGTAPTSTEPQYRTLTNTTTVNSDASVNGSAIWRSGRNIVLQGRININATASVRGCILCITDSNVATMDATTFNAATGPAANYAGFVQDSGSNVASGADFICITGDGTTTSNGQDSGIAIVASTGHSFEIDMNDVIGNVVFKIDGNIVCGSATHLPTSGTNMEYMVSTRDIGTTATTVGYSGIYVEADK